MKKYRQLSWQTFKISVASVRVVRIEVAKWLTGVIFHNSLSVTTLASFETIFLSLSASIAEMKESHRDSGPENMEDGIWQLLIFYWDSVEGREKNKKEHCHIVQQYFLIWTSLPFHLFHHILQHCFVVQGIFCSSRFHKFVIELSHPKNVINMIFIMIRHFHTQIISPHKNKTYLGHRLRECSLL